MMKTRTHPRHARPRVRSYSQPPARCRRKPTWGIHAFYSRITAENRRDWRRFRPTLRPGLERDTQLMPWLIADTVCGEVAHFLGVEIPARYADWLDAKAERCYAGAPVLSEAHAQRGQCRARVAGRFYAPLAGRLVGQ
jgi:hypothetical protein